MLGKWRQVEPWAQWRVSPDLLTEVQANGKPISTKRRTVLEEGQLKLSYDFHKCMQHIHTHEHAHMYSLSLSLLKFQCMI